MAIENRPGQPPQINLGGNYAQPGGSSGSVPEGGQLDRALGWAGDRNSGSPCYDTENRDMSDYSKLFGDEVASALSPTASKFVDTVLAALRRLYENSQLATSPKSATSGLVANIASWASDKA